MIVNTASKCGLTPQYKGLQELYNRFKSKGFVIVGFPANNFYGKSQDLTKKYQLFVRRIMGLLSL